MATVTLRLAPRPAHVRTARLVASAMARRGGVSEDLLDDVRLAVGEACARAVRLHERHGVADSVTLELVDGETFTIVVADRVTNGVVSSDGGDREDLVAGMVVGQGSAATSGHADPVTHDGPAGRTAPAGRAPFPGVTAPGTEPWVESERLGLAVLAGVVDDLQVERGPHGTRVHMRWPVEG